MASPLFDFSHLTPAEREQLANELWKSLADEPEALPLTDGQANELDRRLAAYQSDPNSAVPWREALEDLEKSGACPPLFLFGPKRGLTSEKHGSGTKRADWSWAEEILAAVREVLEAVEKSRRFYWNRSSLPLETTTASTAFDRRFHWNLSSNAPEFVARSTSNGPRRSVADASSR